MGNCLSVCVGVCACAHARQSTSVFSGSIYARAVSTGHARAHSLSHTHMYIHAHTHTQVRTSKPPRASESFRTDARKVHLCHHCSSATQVRKAKTEGSLGITIQGMGHSRYQCYCTHHDRADQYVHSV